MGTNNLSAEPPDSPDVVIGAITKAIDLMKKASPETQIVLLSLPPNGPTPNTPLQQRVSETNRLLATCATAKEVTFVDLHGAVTLPDGRWKPGCTVDGTHLSAAGYALAIKVLIPALTPLLKPGSP